MSAGATSVMIVGPGLRLSCGRPKGPVWIYTRRQGRRLGKLKLLLGSLRRVGRTWAP